MIRFLILLTTAISSIAFSADWVYIGTDSKNAKFMIDIESLSEEKSSYPYNQYLRVWVKSLEKEKDNKTKKYFSVEGKTLYFALCDDKKIHSQQIIKLKSGKVISSSENNFLNFHYVSPDSIGERIVDSACIAYFAKNRFLNRSIDFMTEAEFIKQALELNGDTVLQSLLNSDKQVKVAAESATTTQEEWHQEYQKAAVEFLAKRENYIFNDEGSYPRKVLQEEIDKLADSRYGSRELLRKARENTLKRLNEGSSAYPIPQYSDF